MKITSDVTRALSQRKIKPIPLVLFYVIAKTNRWQFDMVFSFTDHKITSLNVQNSAMKTRTDGCACASCVFVVLDVIV